jgi:hypothetical protein
MVVVILLMRGASHGKDFVYVARHILISLHLVGPVMV